MLKRIGAFMLAAIILGLTIMPEALAHDRRRSRVSRNFNAYRYRGVAADRYYRGVAANRYYNSGYYTGRSYYYPNGYYSGRSYYYPSGYYNGTRYYNRGSYYRGRNGIGSTGRAILTIGAPAAIGAGVGALLSGKRGALVGALLGGGGGAAYYLLKHRSRRY